MNRKPHDLPNYQRPELARLLPALKVLEDCYAGLYGKKEDYLLRNGQEPPWAYQNRVERATFNNKLKPIVDSCAGLLTAFTIAELPESLEAAQDDIDLSGASLSQFLQQCDRLSLRDGYCFVLVGWHGTNDGDRTAADDITNPQRPYLKCIPRQSVINWRHRQVEGLSVLTQVTIAMQSEQEQGEFGCASVTQYHVLSLAEGGVRHRAWEIDRKGEPVLASESMSDNQAIPLICYPCSEDAFNCDTPPLHKLAELNIKLFRKESILDEIEYRVNAPTVVRYWPDEVPQSPGAVVVGATSVIEVPNASRGSKVEILEIQGGGMAQLQASIDKLKNDIEAEGMNFLSGTNAVERTATEAFLSTAQIKAILDGYMSAKLSAVERIVALWCGWTGEEFVTEFSADANLLEQPLTAQDIQAWLGLYNSRVLSLQTLLEIVTSGLGDRIGHSIEEEIERIKDEFGVESQPPPTSIEDTSGFETVSDEEE